MEQQTEEVKALIREIRMLEDNASYFGMAIRMSLEQNITQIEAWKRIERRRKELGLNPKYTSKFSFYEQKWQYIQKGYKLNFNAK